MNKTNAYLILNGQLLTNIVTDLKNGTHVKIGFHITKENINANREWNLVSAIPAKVSRAKKYASDAHQSTITEVYATEINPKEFHIKYD